jgi:hypothetical protein
MVAAGAEAETSSILSTAEDEGWIKAELCVERTFTFIPSADTIPGSSYVCVPELCS